MTVTTAANTPPGVYTINVSGTIPGQNPVSTNVSLTVSSTPGAPVTITNSPSSSTFWVDGVAYAGNASFVPQSGGDTLTVTQTQPPPTGRGDHYQFSPDGGVTTQAAEVPPPGQPGGNGCPWTCSNGSCGSRVPVGPPQPAPRIQNVTDASGDNPAVLYPGVPVQITVNGSNFGGATGYLNFCRPGGSPCDFTSNGGLSSRIISWNPYQIVATVTLPTDAPTGGWLVYVSAMFWISGTDWLNPSMGNMNVTIPPQVSGPIGVALNGSASFAVTITPGNMDPVTVTLSTTSGTGSATFADGTTSQTIYESQSLTVMGKVVSSTANNITISTSIGGNPFGSAQFSVVSVTISLNATQGGQPAGDDSAKGVWLPTVLSGGPLGAQININAGGVTRCAIGVELVGTVTPSNYSGTITLQRNFLGGTGYIGSGSPTNFPAQPDNSNIEFEVTTPSAAGHVYDLDAPNINPNTLVSRARYNFQEYALLGVPADPPNNPPQVGSGFPYYARMSCGTDVNGNPVFNNAVNGDNQAGGGVTLLTWNLQ